MSCCPPGSWPALVEADQPNSSYNGNEMDIGDGVMAYVVEPPAGTTCVGGLISFQDIYQYNTGRCKGVMDQFAQEGYVVVHVDFVGTDVYTDDQNLMDWVRARSYTEFIQPRLIKTVIPFLKSKIGNDQKKIGAIGFCWGCYIAFQACADVQQQDTIAATALFHPTFQLNSAFPNADPESKDIAQQVKCPTLLIPAGNDPEFVGPTGSIMTILQQSSPTSKSIVLSDMQHGFVNRGDVTDPNVKRDVQIALQHAIDFFTEHVKM